MTFRFGLYEKVSPICVGQNFITWFCLLATNWFRWKSTFNMADTKRIISFILHLTAILSLLLYLYTIIIIWRMNYKRINHPHPHLMDNFIFCAVLIASFNFSRRNFYFQKLRSLHGRRLCQKKRSCWHIPGHSEEFRTNLFNNISSSYSGNLSPNRRVPSVEKRLLVP